MAQQFWLILEKSDETRVSQGIDGYRDVTGESYQYDSLVPNHKRLKPGDGVVLRKENAILGVATVKDIKVKRGVEKVHRRCPHCSSTDIRERSGLSPKWMCPRCRSQFDHPRFTTSTVDSYTAALEGFTRLNRPPGVPEVKRCASKGDGAKSQLSILGLDQSKVQRVFEGVGARLSPSQPAAGRAGQGFGLSQPERRQVELRAMQIGRRLYEDMGWQVVDKSGSHPFDLLATRGNERRFVEVKGTVGEGVSVMLTHGEVEHARKNPGTSALVVVSGITLAYDGDSVSADGGRISTHLDTWTISDSDLRPTEYRYTIPANLHAVNLVE